MTELVSNNYYYPNKLGLIILQAMEEILDSNGINAVLNLSNQSHLINNYPPDNLDKQFQFSTISDILVALEEIYGLRGGHGLAIRSGRASFRYGLREFGPAIGISDTAFRLLPLPTKIREGASILAETFNTYSDQLVRIEDLPDYILWHIDRCPICWQRSTDRPVCHLAVGAIQEGLYWISGGKYFNVEEILCTAAGDPTCTIQINKVPLD